MKDEQRYLIRSVSRSLGLLKALSTAEFGLSLAEIGRRCNLNRSTAFRLLVTLRANGFVERERDTRKYRLGVACLELGSAFLRHSDIRREALPILRDLRDACGETVHLARLDGSEVVYLEKLDGLLPIGLMGSRVGARAPAHCTGLGKAMLAYMSESEIRELYAQSGFRRYTQSTITDLQELLEELASIRERGYAADDEEHEPDVKCVAVRVQDYRQSVAGAISVSGPVERIDRATAELGLVARVKEAGQAISGRLAAEESRKRPTDFG